MEKMQKMNYVPQILFYGTIRSELASSCLSKVFNIPISNIFTEETPQGVDFDRILTEGYFILYTFPEGNLNVRADGFISSNLFTEQNLLNLSTCSERLICVDHSESDENKRFDSYYNRKQSKNVMVRIIDTENDEFLYQLEGAESFLSS